MDIEEIKATVAKIAKESDDDERAHDDEDQLYIAFVKAVAESDLESWNEMAKEVLKTHDIKFARWCA